MGPFLTLANIQLFRSDPAIIFEPIIRPRRMASPMIPAPNNELLPLSSDAPATCARDVSSGGTSLSGSSIITTSGSGSVVITISSSSGSGAGALFNVDSAVQPSGEVSKSTFQNQYNVPPTEAWTGPPTILPIAPAICSPIFVPPADSLMFDKLFTST